MYATALLGRWMLYKTHTHGKDAAPFLISEAVQDTAGRVLQEVFDEKHLILF